MKPSSDSFTVARWTVPFAAYLLGTALVAKAEGFWYAIGYGAVVIAVSMTAYLLKSNRLVCPHRHIALPIGIGIVGIIAWIALTKLGVDDAIQSVLPAWIRPAGRPSFNPMAEFDADWKRIAYVVVRIIGIALIVPLAEELFWRGFLMRWLVSDNWQSVPIGTFTAFSFLGVVILFTLAHVEWTAAIVYCVLLNGYACWKKDLWGCMVAHSVSNSILVAYVLLSHDWRFW
jgi:uncharacterized protein